MLLVLCNAFAHFVVFEHFYLSYPTLNMVLFPFFFIFLTYSLVSAKLIGTLYTGKDEAEESQF